MKIFKWINQALDWNEAVGLEIRSMKKEDKMDRFMHRIGPWYLLIFIPWLWRECYGQVYNPENNTMKVLFILTALMYPFIVLESLTRARRIIRKIKTKK